MSHLIINIIVSRGFMDLYCAIVLISSDLFHVKLLNFILYENVLKII